jgi:putative oxidoreductase
MLRQFLFGSDVTGAPLTNLGLLALRVFTGIGLITHGYTKIPPSAQFVEGVGKLGFPAPQVFAWAAGLSEAAGGALLIVGLLTRPSAFFVLFTMAVAAFGQHAADPFATKEKALLYGFIALFFLLAGAGEWSVDALMRRSGGSRGGRRRR